MLHGGKVKAGRVVWAKEMQYLHVEDDESGAYWAGLMTTNQDEDDRAFIPHRPDLMPGGKDAPRAGINFNANVDDVDVTEQEIYSLKDMVHEWVRAEKAAVVQLDSDEDVEEGGGGEGGGEEGSGEKGGGEKGGCKESGGGGGEEGGEEDADGAGSVPSPRRPTRRSAARTRDRGSDADGAGGGAGAIGGDGADADGAGGIEGDGADAVGPDTDVAGAGDDANGVGAGGIGGGGPDASGGWDGVAATGRGEAASTAKFPPLPSVPRLPRRARSGGWARCAGAHLGHAPLRPAHFERGRGLGAAFEEGNVGPPPVVGGARSEGEHCFGL